MGPIAVVLASLGHRVTGCDLREPVARRALETAGVGVRVGHDAAHVEGVDVLAVSTAIGDDNPDVVAARQRGLPVLRRSSVLAAIAQERRTIAVSGTHGKTTTAALVATVLRTAGVDPSFVIGAPVRGLDGAGACGTGDWFVVEADESDATFLAFEPEVAVVTNVEPDHLEFWGGFDRLVDAFRRFASKGRAAVLCVDDAVAKSIADDLPASITYGIDADADWRARDVEGDREATTFEVWHLGELIGEARLAAPGRHNVRNALAAVAAAHAAGVPADEAVAGLGEFMGVARRFELRGRAGGVTFVDSYDHLPGEVSAVLAGARAGGWKRIVCVFQPHRYSRTAALGSTFRDAFIDADVVGITDIYPADEPPQPGVTGELVLRAVLDAHPWADVAYLPKLDDVVRWLQVRLRPGDLCLTLGAGDLTEVPDRVMGAER
jgi:UDP-N-acetylmuramate--alanine ligase